uniref:Uncharacterized protein n=1 Tax=Podoviridae sp. ct8Lf7 TaxID=2827723 RepID=A0A8S5S209_9CAUD|nr:MAG TPA: hypothetical protein [Podoviridae sp. ct8Lf7]
MHIRWSHKNLEITLLLRVFVLVFASVTRSSTLISSLPAC